MGMVVGAGMEVVPGVSENVGGSVAKIGKDDCVVLGMAEEGNGLESSI